MGSRGLEASLPWLLTRAAARRRGSAPRRGRAPLRTNMLGGVAGNALEWYDFAILGFLAPQIGRNFFPSDDPLVSLLGAFGVFAAAFLARPAGGLLFGYIGDRRGRKTSLQLSVALMAVPTFLVGLLPTYRDAGVLAPLLLVLLRMAQGLSVGGELVGSIAFVAENAPEERRGYYCSWTFASEYGGMMLGSLLTAGLSLGLGAQAMDSWGWRVPFLAGALIAVVAFWMRKSLSETPVFLALEDRKRLGRNPVAEAVQLVPERILHLFFLVILVGAGFYTLFVWWPTYLGSVLRPDVPGVAGLNAFSLLLLMVFIPFTGSLSDRLGRKPLLVWSCAGMTVFTLPLFQLAQQGGVAGLFVSQTAFTALMALYLGPVPAALVEMFPPRMRYSAMGIGYNLSLCVFGGAAPVAATWLMQGRETAFAPALVLTVLSGINLLAALTMRERSPGAADGVPGKRSRDLA
ncbi:MFS transporter [Fundidesulfovibrio magnetotacticus]|nr:MFS transporter [Fundidesulfovibrio magnetotacticus]